MEIEVSRAGDRQPPGVGLHLRSSGDGLHTASPDEPYLQSAISEAAESGKPLNYEALKVACCPALKELLQIASAKIPFTQK